MLITVKVFPNSKKASVLKKSERRFEVRVKEKAENNLANKAVRQALAFYLKIPISSVHLARGGNQPNKIFEIKGKEG